MKIQHLASAMALLLALPLTAQTETPKQDPAPQSKEQVDAKTEKLWRIETAGIGG